MLPDYLHLMIAIFLCEDREFGLSEPLDAQIPMGYSSSISAPSPSIDGEDSKTKSRNDYVPRFHFKVNVLPINTSA